MRVKLEDVCERGTSSLMQKDIVDKNGKYPVYGASGRIGSMETYQQEHQTVAVVKDGAGIGRTMLLPEKSSVIGTMQYLIPKNCIESEYLYYVVKYMHLEKYSSGATIPHIYFRDYKTEEFNLHDKTEQREIVSTLKRIEAIISNRQEQLTKLDELIKARFVEMFGDPSDNTEGWPILSLNDIIATIESGWSGNGKQRKKAPGEIAVLKVSAVTKGYFIPTECKVLDNQSNIKKYVFPQKGDLLFSRANTREMVGATALINQDYPELILPDKLWKIRFSENVDVVYMKYILSSKTIRDSFSAASTGTSGSMYNVSMEKFRSIVVPVPPLSLQNQFADFVEEVDKSKLLAELFAQNACILAENRSK